MQKCRDYAMVVRHGWGQKWPSSSIEHIGQDRRSTLKQLQVTFRLLDGCVWYTVDEWLGYCKVCSRWGDETTVWPTEAKQNSHITVISKVVKPKAMSFGATSSTALRQSAPPQSGEEDVSNGMEPFHITCKRGLKGMWGRGRWLQQYFWTSLSFM
jgi:hypothetical protein